VQLEAPEEPRQAEVVDLMERLRRSLEQSGGKGTTAKTAKSRSAAKRTGAKRPRKSRAA